MKLFMMLKTKTKAYWILLFVFMSIVQVNVCDATMSLRRDSVTQPLEIRIDPVSANGGIDAILFDSIQYVPLETNRQSEFSAISQLEVYKNYYIILDRNLNTLFFFRKDGSFSHKLDKDNANVPFTSISRFTIDKEKDVLSFDDLMNSRRYTLDLNTNSLTHQPRNESYRDYISFDGYQLYYHLQEDIGSDFASIVRFDAKTGRRLGSYLPADKARKNVSLAESFHHFYHSDQGHLLFTRPYDYTVYGFDSSAVPFIRYRFILPLSNVIPPDFLSNAVYYNKWSEYLRSNKSIIYSIQAVYQAENWLTFHLFPTRKGGTFLYHLITGGLFNLGEIEDGATGLPIVERLKPVIGNDRGALISELSFLSLKKKYEEASKSERADLLPAQLNALMDRKSHNSILRLSYLKKH